MPKKKKKIPDTLLNKYILFNWGFITLLIASLYLSFFLTQQGSSKSGGESTDSGSAVNTLSSKADHHQAAQLEPESPISIKANSSSDHLQGFNQKHQQLQQQQQQFQQDHMASSDHTPSRSTAGPSSQIHSPSSSAKLTQEKVFFFFFLSLS